MTPKYDHTQTQKPNSKLGISLSKRWPHLAVKYQFPEYVPYDLNGTETEQFLST